MFFSQPLDGTKQCIVNVTYGSNCDQKLDVYMGDQVSTDSSVTTPPLNLLGNVADYCFTATARSHNVTVIVEGTLHHSNACYIFART